MSEMRALRSWLVCASMASIGATAAQNNPRSYVEELAATRKAGLPTKPSDMRLPPIADSVNAAAVYRELDALLKAKPEGETYDELVGLLRPTTLTTAQMAPARQLLQKRRDILVLVHKAASRPQCDFARDWSQGANLLFPEYSRMRAGARWLTGESGLLLRDGKPIEAVKNMSLGFRIANHGDTDSTLIGHLVAIAIDSITFRGLENILHLAGDKPGVAETVRKVVEQEWKPRSLSAAVRGETVLDLVTVEKVRRGDYTLEDIRTLATGEAQGTSQQKRSLTPGERNELKSIAGLNGAYILKMLRSIEALADKPYPVASKGVHDISQQIERDQSARLVLVTILLPTYDKTPDRRASDMARAAVFRSAAAVLGWKLKHGTLPIQLADAITPVPVDPFNLKPLRYVREGDGFTVYSVGTTGQFDGRAKDRKQYNLEAVFAYPAPAFLSQPAP